MENLAHAVELTVRARGALEGTGRHPRGAVKRAHEIREIAEANGVRDVRDRALLLGQQARCAAEAGAYEVQAAWSAAQRPRALCRDLGGRRARPGGLVRNVQRTWLRTPGIPAERCRCLALFLN